MKQTAVDWLQQSLEDTILTHEQIMQTIGLFEQAKDIDAERAYGIYEKWFWDNLPSKSSSEGKLSQKEFYNRYFKMKQTAVEWLVNMWEMQGTITPLDIREAKRIEKEQIEDAFEKSRLTHPMIGFKHKTFKDYYNETFNTNEK